MTEPVEPKYREQMNSIARSLDEAFNGAERPKRVGFSLFIFEFNKIEGGRVNYISNAPREDMLVAVREWLARAEGRAHDEPKGRQ
jgi:hypothetical protein